VIYNVKVYEKVNGRNTPVQLFERGEKVLYTGRLIGFDKSGNAIIIMPDGFVDFVNPKYIQVLNYLEEKKDENLSCIMPITL